MKRNVLAIALAFLLVVVLAFVITPETHAATGHTDGGTAHCVCNKKAVGQPGHTCDEYVTWQAITTPEEFTNAFANGGHYYLANDITFTATITSEKETTICLNGKQLIANCAGYSITSQTKTNSLTFTDCTNSGVFTTYSSSINANALIRGSAYGKINIYGGTFYNKRQGGNRVIYLDTSTEYRRAVLNVYGGTITHTSGGCATTVGALIYLEDFVTANIYGGNITGGTLKPSSSAAATAGYGGAIGVSTDTSIVNVYGGNITGGNAVVQNNVTESRGGNIGMHKGTLNIYGGNITGGSATVGGDIYVSADANISISGNPVIDDLYLANGKTINVGTMTAGASVGLSMNTIGVFGTVADSDTTSAAYFFSSDSTYAVKQSGTSLSLAEAPAHAHCVCGNQGSHTCGAAATYVPVADWEDLKSAIAALKDADNKVGNFCLTRDLSGSSTIVVYYGTTVNICLNGHDMTSSTVGIQVGGTMNITDCQYNSETHTGGTISSSNSRSVYLYGSSTVNFYAGNITSYADGGSTAVALNNSVGSKNPCETVNGPCAFNMYGGRIIQNNDVSGSDDLITYIGSGNTFNMYGGVIDGNSLAGARALIHVKNGNTFNLVDGTVCNPGTRPLVELLYHTSGSHIYIPTLKTTKDISADISGFVVIEASNNATITLTGSGTVDLAGHSTSVKLPGNDSIGFIDSGNTKVSGADAAKLTVKSGLLAVEREDLNAKRYLRVKNADNTYSFHPFYVSIDKVGINTIAVSDSGNRGAVCVRAIFVANEVVQNILSQTNGSYGVIYGSGTLDEYALVKGTNNFADASDRYATFADGVLYAYFDLTDSLTAANLDKTMSFRAYISLGDTYYSKQIVTVQPRAALSNLNKEAEDIDAYAFNSTQAARMKSLIESYGPNNHLMTPCSNFIDYSKIEDALRDRVIEYMEYILKVQWSPSENITYYRDSSDDTYTLSKNKTYGGIRYVSALGGIAPTGNKYALSHFLDANGKLDISKLKAAVAIDNGDGTYTMNGSIIDAATLQRYCMAVIGNQCTGTPTWAWAQITDRLTGGYTNAFLPVNGCVSLIDEPAAGTTAHDWWEILQNHTSLAYTPDGQKLDNIDYNAYFATEIAASVYAGKEDVGTSVAQMFVARRILQGIGLENVYEAYAKMKPGDGMVDNHCIMVYSVNVVRNSNGKINPAKSTITYFDQAFMSPSTDASYQSKGGTNGICYNTKSAIDYITMTFEEAAITSSHSYIPFTLEVYQNPYLREKAVVTEKVISNTGLVVNDGNELTIAQLKYLRVDANAAIAYVTAEVLDAEGNVVDTVRIYTSYPAGWANRAFELRFNQGSVNVNRGFDVFFNTLSQYIGSNVRISIQVGTGETLDVATITLK